VLLTVPTAPPRPPPPPPAPAALIVLIAAAVFSESTIHDPPKWRPCPITLTDHNATAAIVNVVPARVM
jgi:hypothetical protein